MYNSKPLKLAGIIVIMIEDSTIMNVQKIVKSFFFRGHLPKIGFNTKDPKKVAMGIVRDTFVAFSPNPIITK